MNYLDKTKECKGCGKTIYKKDYTVSNKAWGDKQFCSRSCFLSYTKLKVEEDPNNRKKCKGCGKIMQVRLPVIGHG